MDCRGLGVPGWQAERAFANGERPFCRFELTCRLLFWSVVRAGDLLTCLLQNSGYFVCEGTCRRQFKVLLVGGLAVRRQNDALRLGIDGCTANKALPLM